MVNYNLALNYNTPKRTQQEMEIKEAPLKWCSVPLSDVIARGNRLDASVYDMWLNRLGTTYKIASILTHNYMVKVVLSKMPIMVHE